MKYNKEEKYILDALESGHLKLSTPSAKEIAEIKATAYNTLRKNKRITIRLYSHDYAGIQKKLLKWAFHIKRLFPVYFTVILKAI